MYGLAMEIIIESGSVSAPLLLLAAVFFLGALAAPILLLPRTGPDETPNHAMVVMFASLIPMFGFIVLAAGVFLGSFADVAASKFRETAFEEEVGTLEYVREEVERCAPNSGEDSQTYKWESEGETHLGTVSKSAEVGGTCVYTLTEEVRDGS